MKIYGICESTNITRGQAKSSVMLLFMAITSPRIVMEFQVLQYEDVNKNCLKYVESTQVRQILTRWIANDHLIPYCSANYKQLCFISCNNIVNTNITKTDVVTSYIYNIHVLCPGVNFLYRYTFKIYTYEFQSSGYHTTCS